MPAPDAQATKLSELDSGYIAPLMPDDRFFAMRNLLLIAFFIALLINGLTIGKGLAQEGQPAQPSDDEVNAIAKGLYCPVCENVPLDVCPTLACAQWRDLIREQLAQGWSEEQIKAYFVEHYGDRVLATPPPRGLNWMVYIAPPLAILAGVLVLFQALRSWKRPKPLLSQEQLPEGNLSDEYVARLEEELRKR